MTRLPATPALSTATAVTIALVCVLSVAGRVAIAVGSGAVSGAPPAEQRAGAIGPQFTLTDLQAPTATDAGAPGFGPLAAVVGTLAAVLLRRRR